MDEDSRNRDTRFLGRGPDGEILRDEEGNPLVRSWKHSGMPEGVRFRVSSTAFSVEFEDYYDGHATSTIRMPTEGFTAEGKRWSGGVLEGREWSVEGLEPNTTYVVEGYYSTAPIETDPVQVPQTAELGVHVKTPTA